MEPIVVQNWTTIRGADTTPFIQDLHDYLDAEKYVDWTFWLDVADAPSGASSLTFSIESAPNKDDFSFLTTASTTMDPSAGVVVLRALMNQTLKTQVARWLRWKITPSAANWSTTFRVLAAASRVHSGAFVPTQLSGCQLWLRADEGVTLSSGLVSAWADQSGNGNNASQIAGSLFREADRR